MSRGQIWDFRLTILNDFFMVFLSRARNMATNADFRILSYSSFRHDTVEFEVLAALLSGL